MGREFNYGAILDLLDIGGWNYKKVGSNYMGSCPVCKSGNRTPNTIFNLDTNSFTCFSCGASGGLKTIAENIGVDWKEFLKTQGFNAPNKKLNNEKSNKGMKKKSKSGEPEDKKMDEKGLKIEKDKKKFDISKHLSKNLERGTIAYLNSRGFADVSKLQDNVTILEVSPSFDDELGRWLLSGKSQGYTLAIPFFDTKGEISYLKIRQTRASQNGEMPKVKNLPSKFAPGKIGLLGIEQLIKKDKIPILIMVEGEIDYFTLKYLLPDLNVVAVPQATYSPSEEEMEFLKNKGIEKVYIVFDNDDAGAKGVIKVADAFEKSGIKEIYIGELTDYEGVKDINDLYQYFLNINKDEADESFIDAFLDILNFAEKFENKRNDIFLRELKIVPLKEVQAKDVEFALKGVMPLAYGSLGMIAGKGGVGKSWLSIYLGIIYTITTGKKAFLWLSEEPSHLTKWRSQKVIRTIAKQLASETSLIRMAYADTDFAIDITGKSRSIEDELSKYVFENVYISTDYSTQKSESEWEQFRDRLYSIDFIMLDPLVSFFTGKNENDNAEVGKFMSQFVKWGAEDEKILLFIHHFSKFANEDTETDRSRGATAFVNAVRYKYDLFPVYKGEVLKGSNETSHSFSEKRKKNKSLKEREIGYVKANLEKDNIGAIRYMPERGFSTILQVFDYNEISKNELKREIDEIKIEVPDKAKPDIILDINEDDIPFNLEEDGNDAIDF